jgi:hypothetical protein
MLLKRVAVRAVQREVACVSRGCRGSEGVVVVAMCTSTPVAWCSQDARNGSDYLLHVLMCVDVC